MKKADLKKQVGLGFTREQDELEITGTVEDFKIFKSLPIKIKNAGKGYTYKNIAAGR